MASTFDPLVFISIVAIVIVTIVVILVGYHAAKVLDELHGLIETVRGEADAIAAGRQELLDRTRFAMKWLRIFGGSFMGRK